MMADPAPTVGVVVPRYCRGRPACLPFVVCGFQSPSPFGYSLLGLRGRVFYLVFFKTPPLLQRGGVTQ